MKPAAWRWTTATAPGLATRHLIQQGHTRIGYLCSNHDISDAEDRLQGYYAALEESGLPCNDRLVTFAEPDESGGEQAMTELLGRGPPL
ncbi:LacI family transcriptional repressor [Klebsiella pneumoniae]|uniref:LacI family transcriptional repressor n=1 Tax=Klebsiella pneumoniae TaxID=573 RepID=A0A378BS50_KLEPN|nr:LacI family transcriptional repressor [Klebsiella pneumoniae]